MKKMLLVLIVGVAVGYQLGWRDAKTHEEPIISRTIDRVGGSTRDRYRNDIDSELDRLERR